MKKKVPYQCPAIEVIVMEHEHGVMVGSVTGYESGNWDPAGNGQTGSMKSPQFDSDLGDLINDILTFED